MALRSLATRMRGPAAAYALRRHPGTAVPPAPRALSRFLGTTTTRGQDDIGTRRRLIDMERIRDDLKRYNTEDEIIRDNIRWGSRFYKTVEWISYFMLSFSAAGFTACEVAVRSRKDKGHVQST